MLEPGKSSNQKNTKKEELKARKVVKFFQFHLIFLEKFHLKKTDLVSETEWHPRDAWGLKGCVRPKRVSVLAGQAVGRTLSLSMCLGHGGPLAPGAEQP